MSSYNYIGQGCSKIPEAYKGYNNLSARSLEQVVSQAFNLFKAIVVPKMKEAGSAITLEEMKKHLLPVYGSHFKSISALEEYFHQIASSRYLMGHVSDFPYKLRFSHIFSLEVIEKVREGKYLSFNGYKNTSSPKEKTPYILLPAVSKEEIDQTSISEFDKEMKLALLKLMEGPEFRSWITDADVFFSLENNRPLLKAKSRFFEDRLDVPYYTDKITKAFNFVCKEQKLSNKTAEKNNPFQNVVSFSARPH